MKELLTDINTIGHTFQIVVLLGCMIILAYSVINEKPRVQ